MNLSHANQARPEGLPKLSREALRSQVIALALHEYSHLSGTTEPEGEFLQNMALENFLTADFSGITRLLGRAWITSRSRARRCGNDSTSPSRASR